MNDELDISDDELVHIGVLHKSGRYPWGSGENPYERSKGFLTYVADMRRAGMSDTQIARALSDENNKVSTNEFRANNTIAKNTVQKADISRALQLKSKDMSNSAIGRVMGINESSVRALLKEDTVAKNDALTATAHVLRQEVADKTYIDVGVGAEHYLGVSDSKLKVAVQMLKEEGYHLYYLKVPQLGTSHETTLKVLAPADKTYSDLLKEKDQVKQANGSYSEDGGKHYSRLEPPKQVNKNRVQIRYGNQGGSNMDGVIELRRDVPDISMGNARYAQVRIGVGGTHYIKGMAIYADDLPDGVDIRFNTNKADKGDITKALKPQLAKDKQVEENNPFGSGIKQKHYLDDNGKLQLSALNIVNEEGKWNEWSSKLSSQFLSKQPVTLAKEQLQVRADTLQTEFEDISKLTNPAVKKKLLQAFADSADASAVHLKAAGLPRTKTKVILPINSLKNTEIYAPTYNNGEKVVLVRHPHGGIFEIPELTVNNRNKDARRLIPNAIDAVGINSEVAKRLSGADFDGDTVLVIPNNQGKVKTSPALAALKDFDPQTAYPKYDGMKVMTAADKQHKMGDISNLITDMTIAGANQAELARAVKHSMVVIDAEKHELNYKQSYLDNNISALKVKYQGSARSGATTLISKAQARIDAPLKKERPAAEGGPIDIRTGEKKFRAEPESFVNKAGEKVIKTFRSKQAAETNDLHSLVSKDAQPIELVYAEYGNKLKSLANSARKEMVNTKPLQISQSARGTYAPEVASLKAKLNTALKNAPLERQAQVLANAIANSKAQDNPGLDRSDIKKLKNQALDEARTRVGAHKTPISIEPREWEAIQAGAISTNVLDKILNNTDLDIIKELATPRTALVMDSSKLARARSMLNSGYTQAEVAAALGVSVSTLDTAVNPKVK